MGEHADCNGKKRYKSPREAERAAKYCRKLRDTRLRFYRCPDCKDWHLTSCLGDTFKAGRLRKQFRGKRSGAP